MTTLIGFDVTDGVYPVAGLVQATNGNFYGTTSGCAGCSLGTVFEITAGGRLTNLHNFDGTDGTDPVAGLVQGTDGKFYGTTYTGGSNYNAGTVFEITPVGSLTTLHRFRGTDGANPWAGLVQATDGNFYGTTSGGGAHDGGTIFKITPAGKLSTVYNFCSQPNCTDGDVPSGATSGKLKVTTPSRTLISNVNFRVT